jgi:hypothetical protein
MLGHLSLLGRTEIVRHEFILRYGIDSPLSGSVSPTGYIDDKNDKMVTALQKAEWAHQPNERTGKPPRLFYGWGEGDPHKMAEVAQPANNEYINETN